MPKEAYKIQKKPSYDGGEPDYPYGSRMEMNKDMMEGMGMTGMEVGDMVEVHGYAMISSKSEYSDEDGSEMSMGIQMTEMSVSRKETHDEKMKERMGSMYPDYMG